MRGLPPGLSGRLPSGSLVVGDHGHAARSLRRGCSLPPEQTTEIADYLQANAGRGPQGLDSANPPLRISELPWFVGEHGSKLVARAKADPKIGTMSNCIACHRGAAQGIFEDD